jgi:hypothetical protein
MGEGPCFSRGLVWERAGMGDYPPGPEGDCPAIGELHYTGTDAVLFVAQQDSKPAIPWWIVAEVPAVNHLAALDGFCLRLG